jgi:hypothetical protein
MSKYLRIEVNSSQMSRISQSYGSAASTDLSTSASSAVLPPILATQIEDFTATLSEESIVYCMVDGSMIPTREGEEGNDWKEVKLGRIFANTAIAQQDKHHNRIKSSIYCASLENSSHFCALMDSVLAKLMEEDRTFVFINDGGQWIWNWINTHYPNLKYVQILDYFHASEQLSKCSKLLYGEPKAAKQWLEKQQDLILNDEIATVLSQLEENIAKINTIVKKNEVQKIFNYLQKHQQRMLYKTFKQKGYLIGSGAIESAHRVVLQKRLKQSGQRWSKDGAQNIINLRVLDEAKQWEKIIDIIKKKENSYYAAIAA